MIWKMRVVIIIFRKERKFLRIQVANLVRNTADIIVILILLFNHIVIVKLIPVKIVFNNIVIILIDFSVRAC